MKILHVNILSEEILKSADAICFTSNGIIKKNGELVMGAGVAKAFKNNWPELPQIFGYKVRAGCGCCLSNGNRVHITYPNSSYTKKLRGPKAPDAIISFPTKHHWRDKSDLNLIKKSAEQLVEKTNSREDPYKWKKIFLPAPGCSNGGLDFEKEVRPVLEPILDDRFTITFLPKGNKRI